MMSVWNNVEVPEFKWESADPHTIGRLPMASLATLMEEFQIIEENKLNFGKYNWPKPDFWPWDWPQSPAWDPSSDKPCDLCDAKQCTCINTCLPKNKPQITNEAGKGRGVRVIGIAYTEGQILGELVGEFAPLDTYDDGRAIEFRRPDFDDETYRPDLHRSNG